MRKTFNKLRIYNFFENWKQTLKKRKPINKLRIYNFFLKIRNGPKIKEETDPKKRKPINKM